jgi:hypothetical protein
VGKGTKLLLLAGAIALALAQGGRAAGLPAAQADHAGLFTVGGQVTGGKGPVQVVLYEWPSAVVVSSLRRGQRVPLTLLSEQVSSTGRYRLSVNPSGLRGSIVNMEVVAFSGGAMTARSFSRRLATHVGRLALAMPFGADTMALQTANMHITGARRSKDPCPYESVGLFFKKNVGVRNVVVGGLYSRVPDVTAKFTYSQGQSSSLGVGLSASSSFANFSESGTSSMSQLGTTSFRPVDGHRSRIEVTGFRFGKFRWKCIDAHAGAYWANYQVQADDGAGGAKSRVTRAAFRTPHCIFWQAGSTFKLTHTAAYVFTAGVSIHDYIGIDLSSQTGYDQSASISDHIGHYHRFICGLKNAPEGSHPPPLLVVVGERGR